MEKYLKNKHVQNIGIMLLSALWAIGGRYLTRDIKPDQMGSTIYFGPNSAAIMVAWFIPGLAIIIYTYKEIRLLIQLFFEGGPKVKLGCILSIIIPIALFAGVLALSLQPDKLHSAKGNGVYKIGSDIAPGRWFFVDKPSYSCHWRIIASDGQEIRSDSNEASSPRWAISITNMGIILETDDRELHNIDCGTMKYDQLFQEAP